MSTRKNALVRAFKEAGIETAKLIPGLGILIEGIRGYRDAIEEEQWEAFIKALAERIKGIGQEQRKLLEQGWYGSEEGRQFANKVLATALNAEYADKTEFLANALVKGPTLKSDQARRLKYVDMIRSLSRPALEVLSTAFKTRAADPGFSPQVMTGDVAAILKWDPALVDACVRELGALGPLSSVISWTPELRPRSSFPGGTPALTDFAREFVRFISD